MGTAPATTAGGRQQAGGLTQAELEQLFGVITALQGKMDVVDGQVTRLEEALASR
jgi:hypothetical protein